MKKKLIVITIFLLVVAVIAGLGISQYLSNKPKYNTSYVNGNTAGNLYGAGLFCEYGDTIYFSNPSDGGTLYAMKTDGTGLTKLCDDVASFINVDEHYIYYVRNNAAFGSDFSFLQFNTDSLCRIDHDGKHTVVLDDEPCMYASLFGNYVFYLQYETQTASSLWKVKIDGTEKTKVSSDPYLTCDAMGQYFYHIGTDGRIWRYDTVSCSTEAIYNDNCWMPTVLANDDVYYMDSSDNYKLTKANLSGGEKVHLAEDRLDSYLLCGDYIYFQRSSQTDPALCRIRTDGSDYQVVAEGVYADLNATSNDVYFRDFHTSIMYRTPISDPGTVEIFQP